MKIEDPFLQWLLEIWFPIFFFFTHLCNKSGEQVCKDGGTRLVQTLINRPKKGSHFNECSNLWWIQSWEKIFIVFRSIFPCFIYIANSDIREIAQEASCEKISFLTILWRSIIHLFICVMFVEKIMDYFILHILCQFT